MWILEAQKENNLLDYLSVDEVAKVMKKFLYLKPTSGIYNVGSGKYIELVKIIKVIENYFEKKILVKYEDNKTKNLHFWASTKKIKKNIKWEPKISFNIALKKTIKFYVEKYKN